MKRSISKAFRGSISESQSVIKFLEVIEQFFAKNKKAKTSNLLAKLITMKYKGKGNIREYIMEMSNLITKLKSLKLEIAEDLLVHLVLISLPAHFGQFKVSYNTQKDKWSLNELISHCVQEEERLQRDKTERHMKKQCPKYAAWRVKKVELRLGKKIKVVKSDCGGEYYDRYDGSGEQRLGPFVLFLKECGIVPQYTMPDGYIVLLQEHEDDIGLTEDDPINFCQAMQSSNSKKWVDAMKYELKSIQDNDVWDLIELPEGVKPIGCKWIFKTKKDSKGNIERYKTHLVVKGFTQKEDIDYKETFSPISSKDS
ncbi:hypothetical protein CR513_45661, partial [Mucuna pruriens]